MVYLFFIFLFYSFLWFFLFCFSFSLFSLGREREGRGREGSTGKTNRKDIHNIQFQLSVLDALFLLISYDNYRTKSVPYSVDDNFLNCPISNPIHSIIIVYYLNYDAVGYALRFAFLRSLATCFLCSILRSYSVNSSTARLSPCSASAFVALYFSCSLR